MRAIRPLPRLLSWTLVGLLAGCVSNPPTPPYTPEPGPYTARLLVRGSLQARDAYGIYTYAGSQQCTGQQRIAIGTAEQRPPATLLRAERLTTLSTTVVSSPDKNFCSHVMSFVPRTGRTYVLRLSRVDKTCYAGVWDATDPDKEVLESSMRYRDSKTELCRPLAQSVTVGASRADAAASAPSASGPTR